MTRDSTKVRWQRRDGALSEPAAEADRIRRIAKDRTGPHADALRRKVDPMGARRSVHIAEITGATVEALHVRAHRAKALLRKQLGAVVDTFWIERT